jgi:hypothetical protein
MEENEGPDEEPLDEETGDELADALLDFMSLFSTYVKERDPQLWKMAIDYAKSFAETENVKFLYYDDESDKNEDTGT